MALFLDINGFESAASRDLETIVRAPSDITIDLAEQVVTSPLTGQLVTISPSGAVSFSGPWPAMPNVGYRVVRTLAERRDLHLRIAAETCLFQYDLPNSTAMLHGAGGVVSRPVVVNGVSGIRIYYDAAGCNTAFGTPGYWVVDALGNRTDAPPHVTLFHELIHAWHRVHNTYNPAGPELQAVVDHPGENDYRLERNLPLRNTGAQHHDGGPNCLLGPAPAAPGAVTIKRKGCFIATAAYGSASDPNVIRLRAFRENVLLKTRWGRQFFDLFYEHYYRFSPAIADAMHADRELSDVLRISLVEPIVHYLDQAVEMPDAPFDGVPEPWRGYLERQRETLEMWASQVSLPQGFKGLEVEEAATEVALALRYVLRTPESRRAWLTGLTAAHEIPLGTSESDRAEIQQILSAYGRPAWEQSMVGGALNTAFDSSFGPVNESDVPIDPSRWMYTVTITNRTDQAPAGAASLDLRLFYKKQGQAGVVFREQLNVLPGQSAVFMLCNCSELVSYAFGAWTIAQINGQLTEVLVATLPNDPATDPPVTPQTKADGVSCADSWQIGA